MADGPVIRSADRQYFDEKFGELKEDLKKDIVESKVDIAKLQGSNGLIVTGWISVAVLVFGALGTIIWKVHDGTRARLLLSFRIVRL